MANLTITQREQLQRRITEARMFLEFASDCINRELVHTALTDLDSAKKEIHEMQVELCRIAAEAIQTSRAMNAVAWLNSTTPSV